MSDVKDHVSGRGGNAGAVRLFRDEGDGTFTEVGTANLRGWDSSGLAWTKVPVDSATGALKVYGVNETAGGGGGPATIADGADVAQGATSDASSANTVVGILKAIKAAITGTLSVSGTFWQATQPVSIATNTPDVTDRAARLLGHVTVDNASVAVTMATQTPDVTDRSARLLGHVTVDTAPTTAVTGPLTDTQLRATPVPVSGTVTASGPLTDTQLRATPVPISVATIPEHTVDQGTAGAQAWKVDGSSVTQPVSVSSLPLPAGAALDASVQTTNTHLAAIRASLNELAFNSILEAERSIFA